MDAESGQDVERRLDLARRFARGERPFLAITCGLSGSGKTYASGAALERTRAIRVRSDVERKRLARLDPAARSGSQLDAGLYSRETSDRTFTRLAGLARTIIEAGYPVIVDASFIERERREPFKALAAALGVPFLILHCHAPDEVLSARIVDRRNAGADASEADLDVLRMQQKRVQAVHPAECSELIEIDTVDPASIAAMADRLARLSDAD